METRRRNGTEGSDERGASNDEWRPPGAVRGGTSATLSAQLGDLAPGTLLVAAFTRGPVIPDMSGPPAFAPGTPKSTWGSAWKDGTLQDYRYFGVVHRGNCNILFIDGSVRTMKNTNKDDYLNNGFGPVGGYADSAKEIPEDEVYSLYSLNAKKL